MITLRGPSSLPSAALRRCRGVGVDGPYNLGMAPSDENSGHSTAGRCQLCGRLLGEDRLTRHHLLPRSRSRKMKRRRKGRKELKRRDPSTTVALCGPCHRNVHVSLGNADLARGYDSVEALRDHPGVRRFTEWVKDKPHGRA
jgi:5-methylcytosine-specific restriction endonuclease McrA